MHDFRGYIKTMLLHYNVWEEGMSNKAIAQRLAHLNYIRQKEAEETPFNQLFKR